MKCPICLSKVKVLETRLNDKKNDKKRRYKCINEHRFSTIENVIESSLLQKKIKEVFHIEKIFDLSSIWRK